jgi:hypothetical protein
MAPACVSKGVGSRHQARRIRCLSRPAVGNEDTGDVVDLSNLRRKITANGVALARAARLHGYVSAAADRTRRATGGSYCPPRDRGFQRRNAESALRGNQSRQNRQA